MMEVKTVGLASDHAGFALKQFVKQYLAEKGYAYRDFGTDSEASCDYADYAHRWRSPWNAANATRALPSAAAAKASA